SSPASSPPPPRKASPRPGASPRRRASSAASRAAATWRPPSSSRSAIPSCPPSSPSSTTRASATSPPRCAGRTSTWTSPSATTRWILTPWSSSTAIRRPGRSSGDDLPPRVRLPGGPPAPRREGQVRGREADHDRRRGGARQERRPRHLRRLPLLAHPARPRAQPPPPSPHRPQHLAQPHVLRGRVVHGGRRGGQDRHLVDGYRPALGLVEDPARVCR